MSKSTLLIAKLKLKENCLVPSPRALAVPSRYPWQVAAFVTLMLILLR
ncbi:hypothetical protein JCM17380_18540 [Desulfosporosinus burensis]